MFHILGIAGLILCIGAVCLLSVRGPSLLQRNLITLSSVLLLAYATLNQSLYFSLLEVVVLTGALLAYGNASERTKHLITIGAGIAAVVVLFLLGEITSLEHWLGAAGLIVVSIGYAITSAFYMCLGAVLVTIYAAFRWYETHTTVDAIFCVLNFLFILPSALAAKTQDGPH